MNNAEFQLEPGDPRLTAYVASPLPAWLWSADGVRILWANPAGARVFGAANETALASRIFGPADRHRRQVARLASRLLANGAIRLERLQGFGAVPGGLATCGCSRFDFPDGSHGVLIAAGNIALMAPGPALAAQAQTHNEVQMDAASPDPAKPPGAPVTEQPVAAQPAFNDERPAQSPAGFELFDAFAELPAAEPSHPDLASVLEIDLPHVEATPREAPRTDAISTID